MKVLRFPQKLIKGGKEKPLFERSKLKVVGIVQTLVNKATDQHKLGSMRASPGSFPSQIRITSVLWRPRNPQISFFKISQQWTENNFFLSTHSFDSSNTKVRRDLGLEIQGNPEFYWEAGNLWNQCQSMTPLQGQYCLDKSC